MRNRKKRPLAVTLLLCLLLCLFPSSAAGASKTVRVGYMDYDGFIEKDGRGGFQGYGVAYLNKIAQYTDWEYEYVYSPWTTLLKLLKDGKIDLICTAQYTEERAAIYGYPDYPIGQEATVIYACPDDDGIYYEDYQAMDGRRIGMLQGSFQNQMLKEVEQAHGITLERMFYESDQQVIDALSAHEIDLALLGALSLHNELKVVAQFSSDPFYTITNKADTELLKELNSALDQINSFSPYFERGIYEKYYGSGSASAVPLLTREEHEFIQQSPPVKVACIGEFVPLCYRDQETGIVEGIFPALLEKVSQKSGLPIEVILLEDGNSAMQALDSGAADLLAGIVYQAGLDGEARVPVSEPLLEETLVMLAKSGNVAGIEGSVKIALPYQLRYLESRLSSYYPQHEIRYYHTVEDCIDSLLSGDNDITLQNNYVANYYLQRKAYQSLTATSYLDFDDPLAIIGSTNTNKLLMSVINKSIPCITQEERSAILTTYSIGNPYQDSIGDILWYYRYSIGIIVVLLIILIVVTICYHAWKTRMMLAKREADTYRTISERDILTGVYNRQMFYVKAKELLETNHEILYQFIYMNIENFKLVNDLFGTEEGDRVLTHVADWAKAYAHEHDGIAGRLDSDHFILCLPSEAEQGEVVLHLLHEELKHDPIDMDITVNCGVYQAVDRSKNVQLMCDRAHLASNDSKGNILKPVSYYSNEHRERLMQTQTVLNEMRVALAERQFQIYLQPQISVEKGTLIGAEALVRWVHPERGVIAPAQFIPIFEQNGFIAKLDLYVFEEVCRLQKRWKEEGRERLPVSVNLSRVNFYSRTLREQLLRILNLYEVEPELVELELTESAYAVDNHEMYNRLRQLQSDGFRILMDDFGSGYSALNMLKDAPVDVLKLDLRFLYKSDPYHRSWQILKSIISMTEAIGIPVIAEGVETLEQVEVLSKTSCYAVQGYYHSRPIAVEQFEEKYFK